LPLCFLSWYLQLLRSLVFCVMFYRSLFVILSFIFLPLCFLKKTIDKMTNNDLQNIAQETKDLRSCKYHDRKHNGKKTIDKMTNNDLQNIAQETKDLRSCKYQNRKHNGKKTKRQNDKQRSIVFCVMFYRSLFVILSFCLFAIVFSVLIFTASETFSFLCNVS
jgi:phage FluMu protein gp41